MIIQEEYQKLQINSCKTVIQKVAMMSFVVPMYILQHIKLSYGLHLSIVMYIHHSKCFIAKLIDVYTKIKTKKIADQFL